MPDIGFSELLLIVVIAIIVLGPDKLPEAMKQVAKTLKKIKRAWSDATSDIRRELEMEDMKDELKTYKDELKKLQDETKVDIPTLNSSRDMKDMFK